MNATYALCPLLAALLLPLDCLAQTPPTPRTGPLSDLGDYLADRGITPHVQFLSLAMKLSLIHI